MSHYIDRAETRGARLVAKSKKGLTVAHLRAFLADCDRADLPEDTRVDVSDKVETYGSDFDIELSARVVVPLDVP